MARIYRSGPVEEMVIFTVGNNTKVRRKRIKGNTSPKKQEQNEKQAARELARLINCNFSHGDMLLTLKYSDSTRPADREDALRRMESFLKRVKRRLAKQETELKRIVVTSNVDGETGRETNFHHHIIMPRMAYETVVELWGADKIDYQILRDQKDYTALAVYLIRQVRGLPNKKKWSSSRNLEKPIVDEIVLDAGELVEAPKGAKVVHMDEYDVDRPSQYMRYILPEKLVQKKRAVGARIRRPRKKKNS